MEWLDFFSTDGNIEHVQVLSILTSSAHLFCIDSIYSTVSMWNNNEEMTATNSRNSRNSFLFSMLSKT